MDDYTSEGRDMSALERWQKTKLVIDISIAHAMTLDEAREFLGGISDYLDIARSAIAELEAEVERLKVCGNCEHFDAEESQYCDHPETLDAGYDGDMPYYISAPDKCVFAPSRWAERGTS